MIGVAPFVYLAVLSTKARIDILAGPADARLSNRDAGRQELPRRAVPPGISSFHLQLDHRHRRPPSRIALVLGDARRLRLLPAPFPRAATPGRATILSFRFMPPIAVAIPIFLMVQCVRPRRTRYPDSSCPTSLSACRSSVWIMIGFFDEIPREIDDAALVDGCTRLGVLWRVMLPLVRPGLVVAAICSAPSSSGTSSWSALYVINSRDLQTISLGAATPGQRPTARSTGTSPRPSASSPSSRSSSSRFSSQRYIVRGLTAGAVR